MTLRARTGLALGAVLVVALPMFLYRLGTPPLQNWDEAIHAEVAREIRLTHDWGTMHFADSEYFRKPPLKFWLSAGAELIFGEHEWVTRMWSAGAGIATVLLLTFWITQETGSALTGGLTGLIFLSGRFIFFHAFRTGETDGLLTLFTVLALYGYWRAKPHTTHPVRPGWLYLTGAAIGLAIMTKSAAGILPLMIMGLDYLLSGARQHLPLRRFLGPAAFAFAIVLPWHLYESVKWGSRFWGEYLGLHVLKRATEVLHNPGASEGWYGPILFKRFFPFSLWLIPAMLWAVRGWFWRRRTDMLWVLWIVATYLLFTLAKTKFDWYLLPLYPAAAVLVAKYFVAIRGAARNWIVGSGHALALGAFVALLPQFIPRDGALWMLVPSAWVAEKIPAVVVGILFGVAAFLLPRHRGFGKRMFWAAAVPAVGMALAFNLSTVRHDGRPGPMREVAQWIAEQPGEHPVFIHRVDLNGTPYAYYYLRGIPNSVLRETQGHLDWIPENPTFTTYLVEPKDYALSPTLSARYPVGFTTREYEARRSIP
jgi:4-amino-4-deoxy-L-arabinose transferase-like glycosyltransferase